MEGNFKIIFCYNSGKNKALEDDCAKYLEEINFEFMPPITPQQNSVV